MICFWQSLISNREVSLVTLKSLFQPITWTNLDLDAGLRSVSYGIWTWQSRLSINDDEKLYFSYFSHLQWEKALGSKMAFLCWLCNFRYLRLACVSFDRLPTLSLCFEQLLGLVCLIPSKHVYWPYNIYIYKTSVFSVEVLEIYYI